MGNIFKNRVEGWTDLDIMMNGEAVISYRKDDSFILTKIRTQKVVLSPSNFCKVIENSLMNEIDAALVANKTLLCDGVLWHISLYSVEDSNTKFYHFCYTELDNHYVMLQSTTDCIGSISLLEESLSMLFNAIDFKSLLGEVGVLQNEAGAVRASAVNDVQLCAPDCNMLFFVGKDDYVVIELRDSIEEHFVARQRNMIESLSSSEFTVETLELFTSAACNSAKYQLLRSGTSLGFICYEEKCVKEGLAISSITYSKYTEAVSMKQCIELEVVA